MNIWNKLVCVVRIKFFISGEIFESYAIVLTSTYKHLPCTSVFEGIQ